MQRAAIFPDSKEFVDRPLSANVSEVLAAFSDIPPNETMSVLGAFVANWTLDAGSDLEQWTPEDWVQR